jgi:hypothetical protein
MDRYVEQIVAKKAESKDAAARFMLVVGGSLLAAALVFFGLVFFPYLIMFSFGAMWLTWFLLQSTYIEYEYIVTNDEMDIDKIIARKKRKRLITIKISKAEEWGEYAAGKAETATVTVQAHDCGYKNLWYIVTHHEAHGKTAVLFSPNRAVLEAVNKAVPYNMRKRELKEEEE